MDPDSTGSGENYSSEISSQKHIDLPPDDFLTELFSEYKESQTVQEESKSVNNNQLEVNVVNNIQLKKEPIGIEDNMMNGHASLNDELVTKMEQLKKELKEMKEKSIRQESQIAKYEADLSERMQGFLTKNQELEQLKEKHEAVEKENTEMREKVSQFQAKMYQLQELKIQKSTEESEIMKLHKDITMKEKANIKLKGDLESTYLKLSNKNADLRKLKCINKKLWGRITELIRCLTKNGLLSEKQKQLLLKEHADSLSAIETDSEGESGGYLKTFLDEIIAPAKDKPVVSKESTETPTTTTQNFQKPIISHSNTISISALPLHGVVSQNSTSKDPTPIANNKSYKHSNQDSDSSVAGTVANGEGTVSQKGKSFGSNNYFLKSYRDVVEDPHVSDDCLDVTLNELKDLRQQLAICNTRISPLPRTPSPKSIKSRMQTAPKSEVVRPALCSGKRLSFCHQQSESFEMQSNPSEKTDFLPESQISKYTPDSPNNKYMLSSKRNRDGSLKFDFNASLETHLSLDINTMKVSCTIIPFNHSLMGERETSSQTLSNTIPSFSNKPFYSSTPLIVTDNKKTVVEKQSINVPDFGGFFNGSVAPTACEPENISNSKKGAPEKNFKRYANHNLSDISSSSKHTNSHHPEILINTDQRSFVEAKKSVENGHRDEIQDTKKLHSAFTVPCGNTKMNQRLLQNKIVSDSVQPMQISELDADSSVPKVDISEKVMKSSGKNAELTFKLGGEDIMLTDEIFETEAPSSINNYAASSLKETVSPRKSLKRSRVEKEEKIVLPSQPIEIGFIKTSNAVHAGKITKRKKRVNRKNQRKLNSVDVNQIEKDTTLPSNSVKMEVAKASDTILNGKVTRKKRIKRLKLADAKTDQDCHAEELGDSVIKENGHEAWVTENSIDSHEESKMPKDLLVIVSPKKSFDESGFSNSGAVFQSFAKDKPVGDVCSVNNFSGNDAGNVSTNGNFFMSSSAEANQFDANCLLTSPNNNELPNESKSMKPLMNGSNDTASNNCTKQEKVKTPIKVASKEEFCEDIDFTGISLNPFSSSTFTPRGLFSPSVQSSPNLRSMSNMSVTLSGSEKFNGNESLAFKESADLSNQSPCYPNTRPSNEKGNSSKQTDSRSPTKDISVNHNSNINSPERNQKSNCATFKSNEKTITNGSISCVTSILPDDYNVSSMLPSKDSSVKVNSNQNSPEIVRKSYLPANGVNTGRNGSVLWGEDLSLISPLKDSFVKNNSKQITPERIQKSCSTTPEKGSIANGLLKETSTNGFIDNAGSVLADNDDGLDSDRELVIVENAEDSELDTALPYLVKKKECPSKARKKTPKRKGKKNPNKMTNLNNGSVKKPKKGENVILDQGSIAAAFTFLEQMKFTDLHFKQNQHTLLNAFINPNNTSSSKDVAYHVLKYLASSRANPMLNYHMTHDSSTLLPLSEQCIASVLNQISRRKRHRLNGLLDCTVENAYQLILAKEKFTIYGISSLCRLMTELCKYINDRKMPLMLCSDLLKIQHKYAPYLIASIASVWRELFDVENISDEEKLFQSSIAYAVNKKPKTLTDQQWKHCQSVLSSHLKAPHPSELPENVDILMRILEKRCIDEGEFYDEYILTTPLVVFAAVEGWEWAKEHMINKYIIPNLVKFSEQDLNEKAFYVFCHLYVDICYFCPDEEDPHEVLLNFFENGSQTGGESFIKDAVAMAQLKLLLYKRELLPPYLTDWIAENQCKTTKAEYAEMLFRRRLMADEPELLITEITK